MKFCCYENTNNVVNTCEVVASELTGVFKKLFGDNVGNNDSAKLYCALPPFKKNSTGFDIVFGCFCCKVVNIGHYINVSVDVEPEQFFKLGDREEYDKLFIDEVYNVLNKLFGVSKKGRKTYRDMISYYSKTDFSELIKNTYNVNEDEQITVVIDFGGHRDHNDKSENLGRQVISINICVCFCYTKQFVEGKYYRLREFNENHETYVSEKSFNVDAFKERMIAEFNKQ